VHLFSAKPSNLSYTILFVPAFLISKKKIKGTLRDHLAARVSATNVLKSEFFYPEYKAVARQRLDEQRIHTKQQKSCWQTVVSFRPRRIKHSVCSERMTDNELFPEFLVLVRGMR
jgi:hypothetical protein